MSFVPPLARPWIVQKEADLRAAALYPHDLGLEVRIVDVRATTVQAQPFATESEAVQWAAARHDLYRSQGWEDLGAQAS